MLGYLRSSSDRSISFHSVLALRNERVHHASFTPVEISNCAPITDLCGAISSELALSLIGSPFAIIRGALGIIILVGLGGGGLHFSFRSWRLVLLNLQ